MATLLGDSSIEQEFSLEDSMASSSWASLRWSAALQASSSSSQSHWLCCLLWSDSSPIPQLEGDLDLLIFGARDDCSWPQVSSGVNVELLLQESASLIPHSWCCLTSSPLRVLFLALPVSKNHLCFGLIHSLGCQTQLGEASSFSLLIQYRSRDWGYQLSQEYLLDC